MKQTSNAIRLDGAEASANLETLHWEQNLRLRMLAYGLSRREQEIALLALRGLSNREIADLLFICEQTVKDHLYTTFTKLTIHRRSQLAAKLLWLPSDPAPPALQALAAGVPSAVSVAHAGFIFRSSLTSLS